MAGRKDISPDIDELYGLDPVIEPRDGPAADGSSSGLQPVTVQCPYCGESFETVADLSSGSASYIEDCRICCQPIEFRLSFDDARGLASLEITRSD